MTGVSLAIAAIIFLTNSFLAIGLINSSDDILKLAAADLGWENLNQGHCLE